jgi:hypothetical protein
VQCATVNCAHWLKGWVTTVDIGTKLGQGQAGYIRFHSGRNFVEERVSDTLIRFIFYPGQTCFREHKLPLERVTRNGQVQEFDRWIDGWNENAYRVQQLKRRG